MSSGQPSKIRALVLVAIALGIGFTAGFLVKSSKTSHTAGEALEASEIGSVASGRRLFVDYHCSACHSYRGRGGADGPPLDYMRGQLSAKDIAEMSGDIWNHAPAMQRFFRDENISFPTFKRGEMANLVAYLHGGGPPPTGSGRRTDSEMHGQ